jgi:hypothetical protein
MDASSKVVFLIYFSDRNTQIPALFLQFDDFMCDMGLSGAKSFSCFLVYFQENEF